MNRTIFPNARWLLLPSDEQGRDWQTKSQAIDTQMASLGLDLADESVVIIYDRSPVSLAEAQCLIARPVLGPKRTPTPPLRLLDWTQRPVFSCTLTSLSWNTLSAEAQRFWEGLHLEGHPVQGPFLLVLKRRLRGELSLSAEVLFYE